MAGFLKWASDVLDSVDNQASEKFRTMRGDAGGSQPLAAAPHALDVPAGMYSVDLFEQPPPAGRGGVSTPQGSGARSPLTATTPRRSAPAAAKPGACALLSCFALTITPCFAQRARRFRLKTSCRS